MLIREIMYNPPGPNSDELEYIQIQNRSDQAVTLANPNGAWRIDGGIDYTFPAGTSLGPCETLWLVPFDPGDAVRLNAFAAAHGISAAAETILGPYVGQLSDRGERVAIEFPQASDDPMDPLDISWVVEDDVVYCDLPPWPTDADGGGASLVRVGLDAWESSAVANCRPPEFSPVVLARNTCPNDEAAEIGFTIIDINCAPATYETSIDGGQTWDATTNYAGLANGVYELRVRDSARPGCPAAIQTQILETVVATNCMTTTQVVFADTSIVYGTALAIALNGVAVGPTNGAFVYTLPGGTVVSGATVLAVGTYDITAVHPGDANHYPGTGTATVTVTPAPLTVTADDQVRTEDEPNPAFTASYVGFVNGDGPAGLDQPPTFSTPAHTNSPAGDYPITVTNAADANYVIQFVPGTLTITAGGDADGDGLTRLEELALGTDPDNPDTDGDEFKDGLEVTLNTIPTDGDSYLKIVEYAWDGAGRLASWPVAPGLRYRLETCADLDAPVWTEFGTYTAGAGQTMMSQPAPATPPLLAFRVVYVE